MAHKNGKEKITIEDDHEFFCRFKKGNYVAELGECVKEDVEYANIRSMYFGYREVRFYFEKPVSSATRKWLQRLGPEFRAVLPGPTPLLRTRLYKILSEWKKWPEVKPGEPMDCLSFAFYIVYGIPAEACNGQHLLPQKHLHLARGAAVEPGSIVICWSNGKIVHYAVQWTNKWLLSKLGSEGALCFNTREELVRYYKSDKQSVCELLTKDEFRHVKKHSRLPSASSKLGYKFLDKYI